LRLSPATITIGIVAIFAGLIGAYVVQLALREEEQPAAPEEPSPITVPLAAVDLPAGREIVLEDIALSRMTEAQIRERELPLQRLMLSSEQIIGRVLREPVQQGEPFLTDAMYLQGQGPGLAERLKPGLRAVTLEMPELRSGTFAEGVIVDVLFRARPREEDAGGVAIPEVTVSLVEGVEVLDIDVPRGEARAIGARAPPPPSVTLAVSLEQAKALHAVQGRGDLSLVTRPPGELLSASSDRRPLTLEDLLGIEPEPPEQIFVTEAYYRGSRQVNTFRNNRRVDARGAPGRTFSTGSMRPLGDSPARKGSDDLLDFDPTARGTDSRNTAPRKPPNE